jgi:DNA-binding response OmpR family regulator
VAAGTARTSPGGAAGCDDYDTKPIEFARLEQKMEALLTQPAARSV